MENGILRRGMVIAGAFLGLAFMEVCATVLENAELAIEIDDASYAVRSIVNKKAGGVAFVEPPTNAVLWTAEFRAGPADAKPVRLTSNSPCRADAGAPLGTGPRLVSSARP